MLITKKNKVQFEIILNRTEVGDGLLKSEEPLSIRNVQIEKT